VQQATSATKFNKVYILLSLINEVEILLSLNNTVRRFIPVQVIHNTMIHTIYQIPVCPFSQRVHILASLKGIPDELQLVDVDITIPRSAHILKLSRGTTSLPVMEIEDGRALKESMVLMDYIEDKFKETPIRRKDSYERAVENLMVNTLESKLSIADTA